MVKHLVKNYKLYFRLSMLGTAKKVWKSVNVIFSAKFDAPIGSFMLLFQMLTLKSEKSFVIPFL